MRRKGPTWFWPGRDRRTMHPGCPKQKVKHGSPGCRVSGVSSFFSQVEGAVILVQKFERQSNVRSPDKRSRGGHQRWDIGDSLLFKVLFPPVKWGLLEFYVSCRPPSPFSSSASSSFSGPQPAAPDRTPETMSKGVPERMSEDMQDRMPEWMSEEMQESMSEDMPDRIR